MVTTFKETSQARERILKKAEELFYRQGYQATGINQIIDESGVAKATFYAHFPSKDDLCLAYLRTMSEREIHMVENETAKLKSPLARFMYLIESMEPWLKRTDMKGCAFLNMIPEVPDPKHRLREEGKQLYRELEKKIRQFAAELIASNRTKYGHLDAAKLARDYITIMAGAIALVELYHEIEPMRRGVRMIQELLEAE